MNCLDAFVRLKWDRKDGREKDNMLVSTEWFYHLAALWLESFDHSAFWCNRQIVEKIEIIAERSAQVTNLA